MNSLLPSICNHDQTTRRWKAKRERISNLDQGSGRKDRRASSSCRHHPLRSMKSNPYRFLLTSKTTGKQIRICIKLYSIEMRRRKKNILLIRWSNPSRLKTQQYLTSNVNRKRRSYQKSWRHLLHPFFSSTGGGKGIKKQITHFSWSVTVLAAVARTRNGYAFRPTFFLPPLMGKIDRVLIDGKHED